MTTAVVSATLIIGTGVGATLAATGVKFFPNGDKSEVPVSKTLSPSSTSKPKETDSASEEKDPYEVESNISQVGSDPGEIATYQNGTLGVRAYFAPDGVRVAVVFNCMSSTSPALEIWAHEGQLRGDHDLCSGVNSNGIGPRVGVSYFFPACRQLLPTITVITRGTNIDGTTLIPVPNDIRNSCQQIGNIVPPASEPLPESAIPSVPTPSQTEPQVLSPQSNDQEQTTQMPTTSP